MSLRTNERDICIGLFGTCGDSTWRNEFMKAFDLEGIAYFNPQKPEWREEDAVEEAWHLVNDEVILFPVTDETYAAGSLAESGFSILSALRSNDQRFVVIYIAPNVCPALQVADPAAAKDSARARALVQAHLKKLNHYNVFVVDSLAQMKEISISLYFAAKAVKDARRLCSR